MLTPYKQHVKDWKDCKLCPLHETRNKIVLARGTIPCDVLLIGEAGGPTENLRGKPFVGVAGQLLDIIIEKAMTWEDSINEDDEPERYPAWTYAMTNLIGCIPLDEDGQKFSQPSKESIVACEKRLMEFIQIASPKVIVCVGDISKKWLTGNVYNSKVLKDLMIPMVHITHPAAILRSTIMQRSLAVDKCVATLEEAVDEYVLKY